MRGEGSLTKLPNGRWRGEVRDRHGNRHTRVLKAPSKPEARRLLATFRDEVQGIRCPERVTLEAAVAQWQKSPEYLGLKSQQASRASLNAFLSFVPGTTLVREIDSFLIQQFQADRVTKVKAMTVRRDLAALSGLWRFCQLQGWVARNPVRDAVKIRAERATGLKVATVSEIEGVLETHRGHRLLEPFYTIAWFQSWREKTILYAKWENIDMLDDGTWVAYVSTKTGQKTFRLHPRTVECLKRIHGVERPSEGEGYLVTWKGRRVSDSTLRYHMEKIGAPLPHSVRRGAASELYRRGATLRQIGAILGHATEAQTRQYIHGLVIEGQEAIELL